MPSWEGYLRYLHYSEVQKSKIFHRESGNEEWRNAYTLKEFIARSLEFIFSSLRPSESRHFPDENVLRSSLPLFWCARSPACCSQWLSSRNSDHYYLIIALLTLMSLMSYCCSHHSSLVVPTDLYLICSDFPLLLLFST